MSEREETCCLVEEHMSEVLGGTAEAALYDHITDCEVCRDARFEAERALVTLRGAGADYVPPKDLEQRLLAALAAAPLDTSGALQRRALPLKSAPKPVPDVPKPVPDAPKSVSV